MVMNMESEVFQEALETIALGVVMDFCRKRNIYSSYGEYLSLDTFLRGIAYAESDRNRNAARVSGYSNYPTFAVSLWISNTEYLYDQVNLWVEEAIGEGLDAYDFSDRLKEYLDQELGSAYYGDLTGAKLDIFEWGWEHVNWLELSKEFYREYYEEHPEMKEEDTEEEDEEDV